MNLQEFKHWFQGFTEELSGTPNTKQWERIKKRINEINDVAVTLPVYIQTYVDPYKKWYNNTWLMGNTSAADFNSVSAMNYAGRAEAASL